MIANQSLSAGVGGLDASTIIQNFIKSMPGSQGGSSTAQEKLFTTLADLLTPSASIPWIDSADEEAVDRLLQYLPPNLMTLAKDVEEANQAMDLDEDSPDASTGLQKKKAVLGRVLRSPQFTQSLSSLTIALRDGGLPSISEALNIPVRGGGYMRRGGVPLGGGEAVETFLEGVKEAVSKTAPNDDEKDDSQEGP